MSFLKGRVAGFKPDTESADINTFTRTKFEGFPFSDASSTGVYESQNKEQWRQAKDVAQKKGSDPFQEYKNLTTGRSENPLEQEMVGKFFGEVRKYGPPVNTQDFNQVKSGVRVRK